jgi:hypothetical protein
LVFQYVQCKLKDGSVTDPMKTFIDFTQPWGTCSTASSTGST